MLDVVVFLLLEVDVDGSRMAFVECVVKIGDVLDCFPMTRSLFVSLLHDRTEFFLARTTYKTHTHYICAKTQRANI